MSGGSVVKQRAIEVVAHRGASEDVPEHTLAAYRQALADGADALECDVRLTADGHLVCVHDRRVERTSNGRGAVADLELAQLAELDWGSWKYHGKTPEDDARRLLTLERLLELVAGHSRRVGLAVETKHPTRYAGLVERRLVEILDRFGWARPGEGEESPVRVMSFSPSSLKRMRRLAPGLPAVFLMARVPPQLRDGSLPPGTKIAGPSVRILRTDPDYVARLRERGNAVHVWTVDDPSDVALCAALGVDAIITNRPRRVIEELPSA